MCALEKINFMTVDAFINRVVVLLLLQYVVPYSVKRVALLPDQVFCMYFVKYGDVLLKMPSKEIQ